MRLCSTLIKNLAVVFGISASVCAADTMSENEIRILPKDLSNTPALINTLQDKSLSEVKILSLQFYDEGTKEVNYETFNKIKQIMEEINSRCTSLQVVALNGPFILGTLAGPEIQPNKPEFQKYSPFVAVYTDAMLKFLKSVAHLVVKSSKSIIVGEDYFWGTFLQSLDKLQSIHILGSASKDDILHIKRPKSLIHIYVHNLITPIKTLEVYEEDTVTLNVMNINPLQGCSEAYKMGPDVINTCLSLNILHLKDKNVPFNVMKNEENTWVRNNAEDSQDETGFTKYYVDSILEGLNKPLD